MIFCFVSFFLIMTAFSEQEGMVIVLICAILLLFFLLMAAAIALSVFRYITIYKTLRLTVPEHAWWILLLTPPVSAYAHHIAFWAFALSKDFPTYLKDAPAGTEEAPVQA